MRIKANVMPVVLGGYYNAYGIIRSFGEEGIKSILVDWGKPSFAKRSKYLEAYYNFPNVHTNEDKFVDALRTLGQELAPRRGMLFPTHDSCVITVLTHQAELQQWFEFPTSDWETTRKIFNKKSLYEICERVGVPYPKQMVIRSRKDYEEAISSLRLPLIVKPSIWDDTLIKHAGRKTVVYYQRDREKLDALISLYFGENKESDDRELLVQEYIAGPAQSMIDVTVYSDRQGEVRCWSSMEEIRQSPPETGTCTSIRLTPNDRPENQITFEYTQRILREVGYYGICDAEYKLDPEDGLYKMMEINTRCHMANFTFTAAKMNMPYYLYKEHLGESLQIDMVPQNQHMITVQPVYDRFDATILNKYSDGGYAITRKMWRKSIRGKKTWYGVTLKDPIPAITTWTRSTLNCLHAYYRLKHKIPPDVRTIDYVKNKWA